MNRAISVGPSSSAAKKADAVFKSRSPFAPGNVRRKRFSSAGFFGRGPGLVRQHRPASGAPTYAPSPRSQHQVDVRTSTDRRPLRNRAGPRISATIRTARSRSSGVGTLLDEPPDMTPSFPRTGVSAFRTCRGRFRFLRGLLSIRDCLCLEPLRRLAGLGLR